MKRFVPAFLSSLLAVAALILAPVFPAAGSPHEGPPGRGLRSGVPEEGAKPAPAPGQKPAEEEKPPAPPDQPPIEGEQPRPIENKEAPLTGKPAEGKGEEKKKEEKWDVNNPPG